MSWLHRSRAVESTVREVGADSDADGAGVLVHDSPALADVFSTVGEETRVDILDLGPALAVNLRFYSTVADRVRIAHLLRGEDLRGLDDDEHRLFHSLLGRIATADNETFDLILGWDIFNYLGVDQPSILGHHLAAVAERGALIHVMTTTTDTMPAKPTRFEIAGPGRLVYRPSTGDRVTAPNPPPAEVERWLDPFRITRSVILRHGVREFLAVLE